VGVGIANVLCGDKGGKTAREKKGEGDERGGWVTSSEGE
jgi:hypothetical protein